MCLSSCNDLSFLGVASTSECNEVSSCEGTAEKPTHATCSNLGCVCNEELPALSQLNPADYMAVSVCTAEKVEFRANKCVLNKAGFYLNDLYVNGTTRAETEFEHVVVSCRGKLAYDNGKFNQLIHILKITNKGPEYVFTIDRQVSECAASIVQGADGQQWWQNAVQGFVVLERDSDGNVSRKRQTLIKFGCPLGN